jgi:hypothetical protein
MGGMAAALVSASALINYLMAQGGVETLKGAADAASEPRATATLTAFRDVTPGGDGAASYHGELPAPPKRSGRHADENSLPRSRMRSQIEDSASLMRAAHGALVPEPT